jgi:hypothetical protein
MLSGLNQNYVAGANLLGAVSITRILSKDTTDSSVQDYPYWLSVLQAF